jgi:FkbM family methyltransferase
MPLFKSLQNHIVKRREHAVVGGLTIRLPKGSHLPDIKTKFQLYDLALSEIAAIIETKYPGFRAIDIGANVGDTAALIREHTSAEVLCIEGDAVLLPVLRKNLVALGSSVSFEPSFIGADGGKIDPRRINDLGRNASIVSASGAVGSITTRTLAAVLFDHPKFVDSKLLKIDTEGCDFEILGQAEDFLAEAKPVIFFEYAPYFRPEDPDAGLRTLARLTMLGYSNFIYYDNFGNLLATVSSDQPDLFRQFHSYLSSNRAFGTAVYYFDICAFHEVDKHLAAIAQEFRLAKQRREGPAEVDC